MKTKVGPAAIVAATAVLLAFFYLLYTKSNPSSQGAYNAKYGPPDYVKNMKNGGPGGYSAPHGDAGAPAGGGR